MHRIASSVSGRLQDNSNRLQNCTSIIYLGISTGAKSELWTSYSLCCYCQTGETLVVNVKAEGRVFRSISGNHQHSCPAGTCLPSQTAAEAKDEAESKLFRVALYSFPSLPSLWERAQTAACCKAHSPTGSSLVKGQATRALPGTFQWIGFSAWRTERLRNASCELEFWWGQNNRSSRRAVTSGAQGSQPQGSNSWDLALCETQA